MFFVDIVSPPSCSNAQYRWDISGIGTPFLCAKFDTNWLVWCANRPYRIYYFFLHFDGLVGRREINNFKFGIAVFVRVSRVCVFVFVFGVYRFVAWLFCIQQRHAILAQVKYIDLCQNGISWYILKVCRLDWVRLFVSSIECNVGLCSIVCMLNWNMVPTQK